MLIHSENMKDSDFVKLVAINASEGSAYEMVPSDRFELSTSPLPMVCSTPELRRRCYESARNMPHRNICGKP